MAPDDVVQDLDRPAVCLENAVYRVDGVRHLDREPLLDEILELADHPPGLHELGLVAVQDQLVAPEEHAQPEVLLQRVQELVGARGERPRQLVRDGQGLSRHHRSVVR